MQNLWTLIDFLFRTSKKFNALPFFDELRLYLAPTVFFVLMFRELLVGVKFAITLSIIPNELRYSSRSGGESKGLLREKIHLMLFIVKHAIISKR